MPWLRVVGDPMQWRDDGVVIGLRHHGESGVIVELLTRERGRHMGYVHGGRSRRLRPILQPGNSVQATWQARSEDVLGTVTLEPHVLRAARIMASSLSLQGVNLLCALTRLLPEREPQPALFALTEAILDHIEDDATTPGVMVHLELTLLRELGFGLDLARCAATGSTEDLAFVSPKTGRAVSRTAGLPFRDRILPLPGFLSGTSGDAAPSLDDVSDGFALTEYFLLRDVLRPRGLPLPACRLAYLAALRRKREC